MENIKEWLNSPPAPEDLMEVSTGVYTQPIEVIIEKLNKLCNSGWDTKNFKHQIFVLPVLDKEGNHVIKVSGSIEVVVPIVGGVTRTLTGAATFSTTEYAENEHWAATVKSLAIVNSCQVLGKQFGWALNTLQTILEPSASPANGKRKIREAVKVAPDEGIKLQWNNHVEKNNMKQLRFLYAMYNIPIGENGYHFVKIDE